jgi:hypothetical protein
MAVMALKGLQNLRADDGLGFPQNAGWKKEADFSEHGDDMKTWMTNKHFSTLFSAFRGRSVNLNLQNTGLSGTLGLEQLGKNLKDGEGLRWVMLCFSPLLSPLIMHIPAHNAQRTHRVRCIRYWIWAERSPVTGCRAGDQQVKWHRHFAFCSSRQ